MLLLLLLLLLLSACVLFVCVCLLRFLCFSICVFLCWLCERRSEEEKFDECFALKKKGGKKKEGKTQKIRSFVLSRYKGILLE